MKTGKTGLTLFLGLVLGLTGVCLAENEIPQIDTSTARKPIVAAVYDYFENLGYQGPEPICSKTHGAWLNLAGGDADFVFLTVPTQDELDAFIRSGVDIEMKIYGYDGLVFLGNAVNPVSNLSREDVRRIYSGACRDWIECSDGTWGEIRAYIRNPESGSQRLFESLVWNGYDMPDFEGLGFSQGDVTAAESYIAERYDDMSGITYGVMENVYSIGYNILSYVNHEFLENQTVDRMVRITGNVNMRMYYSLDSEIIAVLPEGTKVAYGGASMVDDRGVVWHRVVGEDGDWGWVSSKYAELEEDDGTLKLFSIDGYAPTRENIASGKYPYATTAYVAIRADEPEDSPARRLYDWIGSEDSRKIIEENSSLSVDVSDSVVLCLRESDNASLAFSMVLDSLNKVPLDRSLLRNFTVDELELLWQGAYAWAGLDFHQEWLKEYFGGKSWYQPCITGYAQAEERMSDVLVNNLDMLSGYLDLLERALSVVRPADLAYEMEGEKIEELQASLTKAGYGRKWGVKGYFGTDTMLSVSDFQRDNGLEPTGRVDAVTRRMLLG